MRRSKGGFDEKKASSCIYDIGVRGGSRTQYLGLSSIDPGWVRFWLNSRLSKNIYSIVCI